MHFSLTNLSFEGPYLAFCSLGSLDRRKRLVGLWVRFLLLSHLTGKGLGERKKISDKQAENVNKKWFSMRKWPLVKESRARQGLGDRGAAFKAMSSFLARSRNADLGELFSISTRGFTYELSSRQGSSSQQKMTCHLSHGPRLGPPLPWKRSQNGRGRGQEAEQTCRVCLAVNTVEMSELGSKRLRSLLH